MDRPSEYAGYFGTATRDRLRRCPISHILRAPPAEPVYLAGRVLTCDPAKDLSSGFGLLVLADTTGEVKLELLEGGEGLCPGDIVGLRASLRDGSLQATDVELLTPYGRDVPFPSPGGEYFRLHQGQVSRAELLRRRDQCLRAVRGYFHQRGYLEVQTPLRVRCPGLEPHLRAEPAGKGRYLITSPEYHMKRLLAGGLERIYSLGPCWRGDEVGHQHLGEFYMLEWYQAYSSLDLLMEETESLLAYVARQVLGGTEITYQGRPLGLRPPFARLSVARAFKQYAGMDINGIVDAAAVRARAVEAGHGPFDQDAPFDHVASRILVDKVEPALAELGPVFLHGFPAPLAALSRLRPEDPAVAERFELYAGGLELANAFGELTDPDEQLRRLQDDQAQRERQGAAPYPIDMRFIEALREGIPPSAGIALGVDRLVMLLCDADQIDQVTAFAPDEI